MPIDDISFHDLRRQLANPLPHPDSEELRDDGAAVIAWLIDQWQQLPSQTIGKTASRTEMEASLSQEAPERGQGFRQAFAEFQDHISPHALRLDHPRFLAFVPAAPTFLSVLGEMLCAGTNFFAGVWLEAAAPAQVELIVLDWFKEFLGYPDRAAGILTGGGSEANLTALVVARERLAWAERPTATLYLTEERHWSIDRAARVIGLRPEQLRVVPVDQCGRMRPTALHTLLDRDRTDGLRPWAVVASAGTTNTGAVDPLAEIAGVCAEHKLWLHVDAAYGWAAILTPDGKARMDGIARADSITLDPHKWFAQTFEAGCLLVREGQLLCDTFAHRPGYMKDVEPVADEVNFADRGLALTRRFRALKIWLSVKGHGVEWFRLLVEHCCGLARFAQKVLERAEAFEILSPAQLGIVCFRHVGHRSVAVMKDRSPSPCPEVDCHASLDALLDRQNETLLNRVRASGQAFLSSTQWQGRLALRFCFVNWRTTAADVEQTVQLLLDLARNGAEC